jgi:outer membrane lipoprotein SlyB
MWNAVTRSSAGSLRRDSRRGVRRPCRWIAASLLLGALDCWTQSPRLLPNEHLREVDARQARQDVQGCIAEGEEFRRTQRGEIAGNVVEEGSARAAEGAAAGAIFGDAGRGAAAGAASAAAGSVVRGVFRSQRLNPEVEEIAKRCLERKGYRVER